LLFHVRSLVLPLVVLPLVVLPLVSI